jgi:hypothetical protein
VSKWIAPPLVAVLTACATPAPGLLPIDYKGAAARIRRACELTKGQQVAGPCATTEVSDEVDSSADDRAEDSEDAGTLVGVEGDAHGTDGDPPDSG